MTLTPREVELVLAEREACAKVAETKRSEHQQLVGQSTEAWSRGYYRATTDCAYYIRSRPQPSAPTGQAEPVADEWTEGAKHTMLQLRLHLRSMIKHARWTINEGTGHHPALPSAIATAKMTLDDAERFYATSPTPPDGYRVVPVDRKGEHPCGECHLKEGEICDICGARRPVDASVNADLIAMMLAEDCSIEDGRISNVPYVAVKIAEAIERSRLQPAAASEAPISAEAVNTTEFPIVERLKAGVTASGGIDISAATITEAAAVIQSLAGALEPFAGLADEIEAMAKQDGSDPENWAKACAWHDLIAARSALVSLREGG